MLRSKSLALALGAFLLAAQPATAAEKADIEEKTATHTIEANLPKLREADGLLADKLKADMMLQLESFRRSAAEEKALAEKEKYDFRPYALTVNWQVELYTFRLLSLIRYDWMYQGGAHGNTAHTSLLFDRKTRQIIDFSHLFGGSEKEARAEIRKYVLRDLLRQKAQNEGKPVEGYEDSFVTNGVTGRFRNFTADPSTEPGRAAGLRIWYGPYEVGAYAEGTFEAFVPHKVFSRFLTTTYKSVFAGRSARK